jgi:branched-chain amino acid transport system ATP-binding protein
VNYGQVRAVDDLALMLRPGAFHAVLGRNGAGKSSALRALSGVINHEVSQMKMFGVDLKGHSVSDRVGVGLVHVPEGRHCFGPLSVRENLAVTLYARRKARRPGPDLDEMFDLFPQLAHRSRQLAGSLSGGEQQMLALARGLLLAPRVLMLDEPSLGLAPKISALFYNHLARTRAANPELAILVVEQRVREVLRHADSGVVMSRGHSQMSWDRAQDAPDADDLGQFL